MTAAAITDKRRWWPLVRRAIIFAFFFLVALLLIQNVNKIQWDRVISAVQSYEIPVLGLAVAVAVVGHLILASFDLLGRAYTGHHLAVPRVMSIGFVTYSFILNLGALVGGVGFRYRLYSRFGVRNSDIARIYSLSLLTNWVAYSVIAGLLFSLQLVEIPADWKLGVGTFRLIGVLFICSALVYLAVCAKSKRRRWTLFGHELILPPARLTLVQLIVGAGNWLAMATIVYILLQQQVTYTTVLGVLLLSAFAALITHVPAGLGVLEAVFVVLLRDKIPPYEIIAAVFAFRAVYYLLPFVFALPLYFWLERVGTRPS